LLCRKLLVILAAAAPMAAALSISLDGAAVRVTGITGAAAVDWSAALAVSVDRPDAPPLAGSFRYESATLTFTPRYPFQPGLAYRVRFAHGAQRAETVLRAAAASGHATAVVERLLPSSSEWPENLLRFYIHFSAPMSRGEAFARLHLLDLTAGAEVKLPFLEIHEELWDGDQRRLTVLFDPGRVKRGLVPHNEVGAPLVAGRRYRLVVEADWRDARNMPLREVFSKEFTAVAAVRAGLDPQSWKITAPRAGSRDPVVVDFPRPLDAGLLVSCLTVANVAGEGRSERDQSRWVFVPDAPWAAAEQQLLIGAALEDVAGNRLGRAFDVDLDVFDRVRPVRQEPQRRTFQPY